MATHATQYPYDANLSLHDGTALTATGVGTVAYYDVGGAYRFPAVAVIAVTACDLTDGNETYDLIIEGSTDTAFTTPKQLGSQTIARGATGRFTIPFDNDQGGTVYQYIRYRPVLGGTTPRSPRRSSWPAVPDGA
jgi:hypothetical protein